MNNSNQTFFQRDVFIDVIKSEAAKDKNVIFMSADFGAPALDSLRENLPDQFIHCGISEQHMIDMAAGLSLSGKKVYVYAMSPFMSLRCLEQIKCSLALMDLPVTVVSVGPGLGYADAGPTHYSTEDLACYRSLVGMEVISPADQISTEQTAKMTLNNPKLRVVRLERNALPNIVDKDTFDINQGFHILKNGSNACILSSGYLLQRALSVAENSNASIGVIDLFRIKEIPISLISELESYKHVITLEEQCLSGGFGSAVLEFICDNNLNIKVTRLGLDEMYFFENGGRDHLLNKYGLSEEDISRAAML